MTEEAQKCDVNKIMSIVKQEFEHVDYMDDEVPVFEAVNITKSEVDNYLMEENAIHTLDNIKTELPFEVNNMISNNFEVKDEFYSVDVKIESNNELDNIKTELPFEVDNMISNNFEVKDEFDSVDVKIESNNELLFCYNCNEDYQDYCTKCAMLVHILNKTVISNTDQRVRDEIPQDILDFKNLFGRIGIFALKVIPENIVLGPFVGLASSQCSWKIKEGKFVVTDDNSKFLSWMWYVNHSRGISGQNLVPFQREGDIYYRSISTIQKGEELLVYFGVEYEDSLNNDVEMDFFPIIEMQVENVFACTFCCLGFRSVAYLAKHKISCNRSTGNFSIQELTQCSFCKIYMDEKEYLDYHMNYCCARDDRKPIVLKPHSHTIEGKTGSIGQLQMYKCSHCIYRTSNKDDLKSHANQHNEVKQYKCGFCCKRFKTRTYLKVHLEKVHTYVEEKQTRKYFGNDASEHKETKKIGHAKESSVVSLAFNYNCATCDYKTNRKYDLERHMKTNHPKEIEYNCEMCIFKTNERSILEIHMKTKHLKEFDRNCEIYDYKANNRSVLGILVETKHLKKFNHICKMCDYKTNRRYTLEKHIKSKHLKEFEYNCEMCTFKTNGRSKLEIHIKTKHLKEFKYNCEMCIFKTNGRSKLEIHIKTKHLKEFKYNCEMCDFKTNERSKLEMHIKTKHLKEFEYNCEMCEFKTNRRYDLEKHEKTKQHCEKLDISV